MIRDVLDGSEEPSLPASVASLVQRVAPRDVTILMKDGETIQDVANLVAFIKSFPGSDLPLGSPTEVFHPPGQPSLDAQHLKMPI